MKDLQHSIRAALLLFLAAGLLSAQAANAETPPPSDPAAANDFLEFDDLFDDSLDEQEFIVINDPFESWNRQVFAFNDGFYQHLLIPVVRTYSSVVPDPVETGIGNFFSNLKYPIRLISYSLQGNFELAGRETGRFLVDTTVGIGGIFRPSDEIPELANLPDVDLGLALAWWDVDHGPYLVLPVLGPSSARDLVGRVGNWFLNPVDYLDDAELILTLRSLDIINDSTSIADNYERMVQSALDPYAATKDFYLQRRQSQLEQIREAASQENP